MMTPSSDTPPDGDFAAYVDRLTGGQTGTQPREELFPSRAATPADAPLEPGAPLDADAQALSFRMIAQAAGGIPFHKHSLWLAAIWFAAQALEQVLPEGGYLFWAALLIYLAWLMFRMNRNTSGALARRVVELARQAEAARKSHSFRRPHL
jgi:hypothetical protein